MTNNATRYAFWLLLITASAQAVFASVPRIDIWVSAQFYDPALGFWMNDDPALNLARNLLRASTWVLAAPALAILVAARIRRAPLRLGTRPWWFACACLAVGPALIVNVGLKDHWGRARPADILEFGGQKQFTPAFQITDQCLRNCSFTSGEAASVSMVALVLIMLAWPRAGRATRIALAGGLGSLAVVAGALRIMMGRHFLSDVVFSFLLSALVATALYHAMGMRRFVGVTPADLVADLRTLRGIADGKRERSRPAATVSEPAPGRRPLGLGIGLVTAGMLAALSLVLLDA